MRLVKFQFKLKTFFVSCFSFTSTTLPFPVGVFSHPSAGLVRMWRRRCRCLRSLGRYLPQWWKPGIHTSQPQHVRGFLPLTDKCVHAVFFGGPISWQDSSLLCWSPDWWAPLCDSLFFVSQDVICPYNVCETIFEQIFSFSAPSKAWLSDEFNWSSKKVSFH